MQIRHGPATVSGDESCTITLGRRPWEVAASRVTRESGDLPPELQEAPKETGEKCDKCGEPMVLKTSRWGKEFLACSAYPKCKNARNVGAPAGEAAAPSAQPSEESVTAQSDD